MTRLRDHRAPGIGDRRWLHVPLLAAFAFVGASCLLTFGGDAALADLTNGTNGADSRYVPKGADEMYRYGSSDGSKRGATPLRKADYVGRLIGGGGGRVSIRITGPKNQRGLFFQARDYPFVCESRTLAVSTLLTARPLNGRGEFEAISVTRLGEIGTSGASFSLAEGVISGKRARGTFFGLRDDCWTDGIVGWRAHKVPSNDSPAPNDGEPGSDPRVPDVEVEDGDRYSGFLAGAPPKLNRVRLEIDSKGERLWVLFRGLIGLDCNGPRHAARIDHRIRLDRRGRFELALYDQDPASLDRTYDRITGSLRPDGRAVGELSHYEDPWDPEGDGDEPECGTSPPSGWKPPVWKVNAVE